MRRIWLTSAVLFVIFLVACSGEPSSNVTVVIDPGLLETTLGISGDLTAASTESNNVASASFDGESFSYFSDQLIVKFSDAKEQDKFLKKFGGTVLNSGAIPAPPASADPKKVRKIPDLGYRLVRLASPLIDNNKLAKKLEKLGMKGKATFSSQEAANLFDLQLRVGEKEFGVIASAEVNSLVQPTGYIEHIKSYNTDNYWWLNDTTTRVTAAWQLRSNPIIDGDGVAIAILDIGFDVSNYDLTSYDPYRNLNVNPSRYVSTYNFANSSYAMPFSDDCAGSCWHGYRASLLAGGARGNQYGRAGVAPNADLILFRIAGGDYKISIYNAGWAVDTAVAWGADVISMSFISRTPSGVGVPGTYLGAALARSYNAGVVNIAAAGNDNQALNGGRWPWVLYPVPAIWSTVIAVGAVNIDRNKSSYSNYGSDVDIWAPAGENSNMTEIAPRPDADCYSSSQCAFVDTRSTFNGTSAATPIVAGVAALMKQVKPSLNTAQVKDIMQRTARRDSSSGLWVVDARAAVQYVLSNP
jgi:subtilisin family serine protease